MKKMILLGLSALLVFVSFAQKAPIKFGKVEISDLEMSVYDKDTSAPAIILCEYGYFNKDMFNFTHLVRIKILKKEGYEYADRVIRAEYKSNVKGFTFNLENGEIVRTKLDNSGIFVEKETDYETVIRVAMPNVKVGSVIDIEYVHPGLPFEWRFQDRIPVLWSELIVEQSPYVKLQQNFFGSQSLCISEGIRWAAKDMPAVREEPYITSISNCFTKFEFDIYEISFPGYYTKSVARSWDDISLVLYSNDYFGDAMMSTNFLNDLEKIIESSTSDEKQRMIMAYNMIKVVKWNGQNSLYASSTSLGDAFREKVGNSADINLMLVQLLKKVGLDAYPVVMSTRDNGVLSPIHPSLHKLNYVIVLARINEDNFLLDATEKNMPYDQLPLRALNFRGRAVDQARSFWVDISNDNKEKETVYYDLKMNEDLEFEGKISMVREGFAAFDFRNDFYSYNSKAEYLDHLVSDKPGMQINGFAPENIDSLMKPVKDSYEVKISNRVDRVGDEAFLYPFFYESLQRNPFISEERIHPVDFGFLKEKSFIFHIILPEGVTVAEIPKSLNLKLPDNSGSFLYQVSVVGRDIQVVCKLNLGKSYFYVEEYPDLREFYNLVIKKQKEPIVLKLT